MADEATTTETPAKKPKVEIPSGDFKFELVGGSADKAGKNAEATSAKMLQVPVNNLRLIPGFNVRIATPDYNEHVSSIAASMKANGYYQNKPLGGFAGKEDGKDVIFVTDGHTRLAAVKLANDNGAEITKVPVVVKPQSETLEDLTIALVQDNEGRPLSPFERAIVVKRLIGYGMDKDLIASRLGVTKRYVDDLEVLAGAPAAVRTMVLRGAVSSTEAIKQLRKDPEKAGAVLKAGVDKAAAEGKSKASAKHMEGGAKSGGNSDQTERSTATTKTVKGKQTDKVVHRLKAGDVVSRDTIKEVLAVDGSSWWEYVDSKDKAKGCKITESVTITLIVEKAAPEGQADTGTTGTEGAEGGQGGDAPLVGDDENLTADDDEGGDAPTPPAEGPQNAPTPPAGDDEAL